MAPHERLDGDVEQPRLSAVEETGGHQPDEQLPLVEQDGDVMGGAQTAPHRQEQDERRQPERPAPIAAPRQEVAPRHDAAADESQDDEGQNDGTERFASGVPVV